MANRCTERVHASGAHTTRPTVIQFPASSVLPMDSATSKKTAEQERQAEIRRQIARLQAQLGSTDHVEDSSEDNPSKRKAQAANVLVPGTPSSVFAQSSSLHPNFNMDQRRESLQNSLPPPSRSLTQDIARPHPHMLPKPPLPFLCRSPRTRRHHLVRQQSSRNLLRPIARRTKSFPRMLSPVRVHSPLHHHQPHCHKIQRQQPAVLETTALR